jgi:AAA+ ATPase superfamily predicted ATPase
MRRFHSYGPVDKDIHFCVPREKLVKNCLDHIIGEPGKGGHYFTIWGPRQTGKTWLMHQVKERIQTDYPDRFIVGTMSMQGVIMKETDEDSAFFSYIPLLMHRTFKLNVPEPDSWKTWQTCFYTEASIFSKPVILFIDEFDKLPSRIIDQLVNLFRDMYLEKENYLLHGLALIGVKAVLGVDSLRGSPFNIQRSLHVESFCRDEVQALFDQYRMESGQTVDADVVQNVFDATNGQPGLVGWFGELLTEKYNPGASQPITLKDWKTVYRRALYVEWNNTILL